MRAGSVSSSLAELLQPLLPVALVGLDLLALVLGEQPELVERPFPSSPASSECAARCASRIARMSAASLPRRERAASPLRVCDQLRRPAPSDADAARRGRAVHQTPAAAAPAPSTSFAVSALSALSSKPQRLVEGLVRVRLQRLPCGCSRQSIARRRPALRRAGATRVRRRATAGRAESRAAPDRPSRRCTPATRSWCTKP